MSETTPETSAPQETAQEPAAAQSNPANDAPPWGEDFDPARAWKTIQNLREREKELSKVVPITDTQRQQLEEHSALVEASKSEAQRKDEAAAAAQSERDNAVAEAARYKLALRHGIAEEDFDLLGSGTEEQIEARAVKIAEKNAKAKQAELEAAVQPASPQARRPVEQLRPGATPSTEAVKDQDAYPADFLPRGMRERMSNRT